MKLNRTIKMKLFIENNARFDEEYTEEYLDELIAATYEVAPKVYRKYNWDDRFMYTVEDYTQDAVMEIIRLFDKRYIHLPDPTKKITNLVYTLLDKHFTFNKYKQLKQTNKQGEFYLSGNEDNNSEYQATGTTLLDQSMMSSDVLTPEDLEDIKYGHDILVHVVDNNLSNKDVRSRTHEYKGYHELLGDITLNDRNLGRLIIEGLTPNDVVEVFGIDPVDNTSAPSLIRKRYRIAMQQLSRAVSDLDRDDLELVEKYLESINM